MRSPVERASVIWSSMVFTASSTSFTDSSGCASINRSINSDLVITPPVETRFRPGPGAESNLSASSGVLFFHLFLNQVTNGFRSTITDRLFLNRFHRLTGLFLFQLAY